jgi:signal transduction histidine kinase
MPTSRKDEFLAMLAHELRNPLAPISNGLTVLRRSTLQSLSQNVSMRCSAGR